MTSTKTHKLSQDVFDLANIYEFHHSHMEDAQDGLCVMVWWHVYICFHIMQSVPVHSRTAMQREVAAPFYLFITDRQIIKEVKWFFLLNDLKWKKKCFLFYIKEAKSFNRCNFKKLKIPQSHWYCSFHRPVWTSH